MTDSEQPKCDVCKGQRWINFAPNPMKLTGGCCPLCNRDGKIPEVPGSELVVVNVMGLLLPRDEGGKG